MLIQLILDACSLGVSESSHSFLPSAKDSSFRTHCFRLGSTYVEYLNSTALFLSRASTSGVQYDDSVSEILTFREVDQSTRGFCTRAVGLWRWIRRVHCGRTIAPVVCNKVTPQHHLSEYFLSLFHCLSVCLSVQGLHHGYLLIPGQFSHPCASLGSL